MSSEFMKGLQGRSFPYYVKRTDDHWWPKGIQRLWTCNEGKLSLIEPTGKVKSAKPPKKKAKKRGFAYIPFGHRIDLGQSPWNRTFETEFDSVDNDAAILLAKLKGVSFDQQKSILSQTNQKKTTDIFVKFCFSLLLRSPAFRFRSSFNGTSFGRPPDPEIGKANIEFVWSSVKNFSCDDCNAGSLTLLHSTQDEFIFGDGLYDAIFDRPISYRYHGPDMILALTGEAFVPLLPNVCAYIAFDSLGRGLSLRHSLIGSTEVVAINNLTQLFSKDYIFFRKKRPPLSTEYQERRHQKIRLGSADPLLLALRP